MHFKMLLTLFFLIL
uniref:Uncharacterized protein n=1 Tax=Arundo donax TaxID=35708 RepID=A0A0A9C6T3_ARUDO